MQFCPTLVTVSADAHNTREIHSRAIVGIIIVIQEAQA